MLWIAHPRRAVTLLEVLASLILATVLCAALFGLTKTVVAQRQMLDRFTSNGGWQVRLKRLLLEDLLTADQMLSQPGRLTLTGITAKNIETGQRTGTQVQIEYRVSDSGLLTRTCRRPSQTSDSTSETILCAVGISRLIVGPTDYDDKDIAALEKAAGRTLYATPANLRCKVLAADGSTALEGFVWRNPG